MSSAPRIAWLVALAFASCQSTDLSKAVSAYRVGDFEVAAAEITSIRSDGQTDGVWIEMQRSSILNAAGRFPESQDALARCQQKIDDLLKDAGAENIAVGGLAGAGAVMTDDRQCNYVGAIYEAQLVCALQAANALLLSDIIGAQAAVSNFRNRVDEASTVKSKTMDHLAAQREINEKEREECAEKYGTHYAKFDGALSLADADGALKSAYVSWADTSVGVGLYLAEVVQRESGRKGEFTGYLNRAASDAAAQKWNQVAYRELADGIKAAVAQLESAQVGASTYVLVGAGLAPQRVLNTERMNAMKAKGLDVQLPGLSEPNYSGKVSVVANGVSHDMALVTNLALLKKNEFDVNYPDMEYRAVLGKIIKEVIKIAGAAVAVTSKDQNAQYAGLAVMLAGAIASAVQGADLRSWDCLPYRYLVVAIPTPADGKVTIKTDAAERVVNVIPGTSNFVEVTSIQPAHCVAHTAPLKAVGIN